MKTAREVLEHAKANDGDIGLFDFHLLYGTPYGDYLVEGTTPLTKILQGARMVQIDIKLPLQDIDNLIGREVL